MKYDVVEEVFGVEKNNGELFKVNKIKWGNGHKYDVRVWKDDVPMQGITFSKEELKSFCKTILESQGVSMVGNLDYEDVSISKDMVSIDLKKVVEQYPDRIKSNTKLKALLKDLFPEHKREIVLLCNVHEEGIADEISKSSLIADHELYRYISVLENDFGVKNIYALWAIQTWADAYGIKCNTNAFLNKLKKDNKDTKGTVKKNSATSIKKGANGIFDIDDTIVANDEITIIYKGMVLSSGISLMLHVINKSDESASVRLCELEINDFEVEQFGSIEIKPEKQTVSRNISVVSSSVISIGVKRTSDINKINCVLLYKVGQKSEKIGVNLVPSFVKV